MLRQIQHDEVETGRGILMTKVILAVLGAFLLGFSALANPIDRYFAVAPGIPIAHSMVEDATSRMVFDSPEGRIVETAATGVIAWSKVEKFYLDTLPQLGWQLKEKAVHRLYFVRDEEGLSLQRSTPVGGQIRVELSIKPVN